ncbi:hypothetical protein RintRC_3243 [Richelia intracellularis]|nr:hypothetical protein RintRC_3243 [Richelia intracellularis]
MHLRHMQIPVDTFFVVGIVPGYIFWSDVCFSSCFKSDFLRGSLSITSHRCPTPPESLQQGAIRYPGILPGGNASIQFFSNSYFAAVRVSGNRDTHLN